MLDFICKSFPLSRHYAYRIRGSASHMLHFLQFSISSSSSKKADRESFTASYLINTCGFPPEKAIVSAKYVGFTTREQPDKVISFFKNQGFSDLDVFKLIRQRPNVLQLSPEKNLLPKIEFLRSLHVLETDLPFFLSHIAAASLKNQIIPCFEILRNLIGTKENTLIAIKRCPRLLDNTKRLLVPNVNTLLRAGVPEEKIGSFLRMNPSRILQRPQRYKELVDMTKDMGIDPRKSTFLKGVMVISGLRRVSWEKKMKVYKSWGCSEEEVLSAFRVYPCCMMLSVEKIEGILKYLVNELGWSAPILLQTPVILALSLKRRIIPRCSVYQILQAKGLTKALSHLWSILLIPESKFVANFVKRYEKEAPELLELYQEKLKQSIMKPSRE